MFLFSSSHPPPFFFLVTENIAFFSLYFWFIVMSCNAMHLREKDRSPFFLRPKKSGHTCIFTFTCMHIRIYYKRIVYIIIIFQVYNKKSKVWVIKASLHAAFFFFCFDAYMHYVHDCWRKRRRKKPIKPTSYLQRLVSPSLSPPFRSPSPPLLCALSL